MRGGGGGGSDRPLFGRRSIAYKFMFSLGQNFKRVEKGTALELFSCCYAYPWPQITLAHFIPLYVEYYFSEADKKILSNKKGKKCVSPLTVLYKKIGIR